MSHWHRTSMLRGKLCKLKVYNQPLLPRGICKTGMFGTTPLNSSALVNSLPEKPQGLAEAATCLTEHKCQQEKIKGKQGKKEMVLLIYFKSFIKYVSSVSQLGSWAKEERHI